MAIGPESETDSRPTADAFVVDTTKKGPPPSRGTLEIIGGNDAGRDIPLDGEAMIIGRGLTADIVLTDIAVSRRHMQLTFEGQEYTARDLGSGNGTIINNIEQETPCRLRNGDRIEIGNTLIKFVHPASGSLGMQHQASKHLKAKGSPRPRRRAPSTKPPPLPKGNPRSTTRPEPSLQSEPDTEPRPKTRQPRSTPAGYPLGSPTPQAPPGAIGRNPRPAERDKRPSPADYPYSPPQSIAASPTPRRESKASRQGRSKTPNLVIVVASALLVAGATVFAASHWQIGPFSNDNNAVLLPTPTDAAIEPAIDTPIEGPATQTRDAAADDTTTVKNVATPPRNRVRVVDAGAATDTTDPKPGRVDPTDTPTPPDRKDPVLDDVDVNAGDVENQIATARSRALIQYRERRFRAATATLRAAAKLPSSSRRKLKSLASNYTAVGDQISAGLRARNSNPTSATSAFRKALSLDAKYGRSAHRSYLRAQLATTAPRAAATYMARKDYEKASRAATTAAQYAGNSDATVRRIRAALNRRAGQLYKQAEGLQKSDKKRARSLLRELQRIVPRSSSWARKAKSLASKLR